MWSKPLPGVDITRDAYTRVRLWVRVRLCQAQTRKALTHRPEWRSVHTTRLVLWDIDHTLLSTGSVGSEIFAAAFEHATGQSMQQMADAWGRTEPAIFTETAELHGIDNPPALFDAFAEAQARGYRERADDMCQRGHVLSGVVECLQRLSAKPEVIQGALTGNTQESARTKLGIFRLDTYLDLAASAYGTDDPDRAKLVDIARHRAADRHQTTIGQGQTVLVGDTPRDIDAGHAGGAVVIAVASGRYDVKALREAGADAFFADLADTDAVTAAILGR